MEDLGYCKGELCNREGCTGIIAVHDSEISCSCHISPPCSYCVTTREYCPQCNWDGREEQIQEDENRRSTITDQYRIGWAKQMQEFTDKRNEFYKKFHSSESINEFNYRKETHSNSSMKVYGIFPKNGEIDMKLIIGTFGGRFERLDKERGRFIYIAYTD